MIICKSSTTQEITNNYWAKAQLHTMNWEAKLTSPSKLLNWSGRQLFWLLALVVLGGAIACEWFTPKYHLLLPIAISTIASAVLGYWIVPFLAKIKAGQFIREDGPQAHLKKAGTPTMGAVFFLPVALIISLIMTKFNPHVVAVSLLTIGYSSIGWLDDWQKLSQKSNDGISPAMKLILQVTFGAIFCAWMMLGNPGSITSINLPLGLVIPLGLLFWPFAVFVMVAESNATNITDGIDGLMGGLGAISFLGVAATIANTAPELATFCACLSGGCLGFVAYNRNPARVFMGDTGSLALGAALTAVALLTNHIWCLFIISGIFFVETMSVLLQVGYYKATKGPDGIGKRLFKMAPFHHHLELSGWQETQVVGVFYLINLILAVWCWLSR